MAKQPTTEAEEFRTGEARARAARAEVGEQVRSLLLERAITGDRGLLAMRLQQLAQAERDGDREALRAAVMEITLAGAAWCVAIDLGQRAPRGRPPEAALVSPRSNGRS